MKMVIKEDEMKYFTKTGGISSTTKYYTIIDFIEVDMRIYLPEKSDIHQGSKAEVNITFKGR